MRLYTAALLLVVSIPCSLVSLGAAATVDAAGPITGVWRGTYVNDNDVPSNGYLEITENEDGSLSGKWGNGPNGTLVIENGERVTESVFQWEAESKMHEQGRYRVRARLMDETLHLSVTYTWREDGNIRGQTGSSTLSKT